MVYRPTILNTNAVLQSMVAHVAQSDEVLIPVARHGARHRLEATLRRSCHRTSNNAILYVVGCLRDSRKSNDKTVSVISCSNPGMAACKIVDALLLRFYTKDWDDVGGSDH